MLEDQRGHLFPWAPVFFAAGIGIYFALDQEPGRLAWFALAVSAALSLGLMLTVWRGRVWPVAGGGTTQPLGSRAFTWVSLLRPH